MRLLTIILQDLKLMMKDKNTFLILILMPTIIVLILGSVFSSSFNMDIDSFDVVFLSDDTAVSFSDANSLSLGESFRDKVLKSDDVKDLIKLREVSQVTEGESLVREGKASAFIHIPKDFTTLYLNGRDTEIKIIGDNKKTIHVSIVRGLVDSFNERLRMAEVSRNQIGKLGQLYSVDPEKVREIINGISEDKPYKEEFIQLSKESFNSKPPLSSIQYYSIAMIAMYALFAAQDMIQLMIEEKKNKTYSRMQASPMSSLEYIFGKLLGIILVIIMQISILVLITRIIYRMEWGNYLYVLIITAVYAFSIGAISLLFGFIAEDDRMISNLSMNVIFVFSFFGGSFIPKESLPGFAQQIQGIVPNGQALIAYLNVVQGASLNSLLKSITPLIVIGIVFLMISLIVAKKKGWSNETVTRNSKTPAKAVV